MYFVVYILCCVAYIFGNVVMLFFKNGMQTIITALLQK